MERILAFGAAHDQELMVVGFLEDLQGWAGEGRVGEAIRSLTDTLTRRPVSDDQVTAQSWGVLRSLAAYKDAALRPEKPAVLQWVPPLLEIEAGDRSRDKSSTSARGCSR